MRRASIRFLMLVLLAVALIYPLAPTTPQALAQEPGTATATPFSSEELLPGVLDVLTTRLAEVSPSVPALEPTASPTRAATQEEGEPSPTRRASATVAVDEATATPVREVTVTIIETDPTSVPLPSATTVPAVETTEEAATGGATPLLIVGGIGVLAIAGFVLWRRAGARQP